MTTFEFQELLRLWCRNEDQGSDEYLSLKEDIEFLSERLFDEYKPTKNTAHGPFSVRIAKWIGSVDQERDQQALFLLLKHLFFVGQDDLEAAMRTAYSRHVIEWLVSELNVNVLEQNARQEIVAALSMVRYTRVTDSFDLPTFLRINGIQGHNIRYTWEEHKQGWHSNEFRRQVMGHGLPNQEEKRYLVLLEDFVGSGSQARNAVEKAQAIQRADDSSAYSVLFCPMIICPDGANWAKNM